MKKIEIPKDYKPSEDEIYMNPMQLEYFKQKLLKWKKNLLLESSNTINFLKNGYQKQGDISDVVSLDINLNLELRTRERYRKLIDKIEIALKKIENSEYGYCEKTGKAIGIKRLEARPIAVLCIEAQEQYEIYEKQYTKIPNINKY